MITRNRTIRTMRVLWIAMIFSGTTALAQSAGEMARQPAPPINEAEPVQVGSLARIVFQREPEAIEDWQSLTEPPPYFAEPILRLRFTAEGTPRTCVTDKSSTYAASLSADLLKRLCDDLLANARVELRFPSYTGGRDGVAAVAVLTSDTPVLDAVLQDGTAVDDWIRLIPMESWRFLDYSPVSADLPGLLGPDDGTLDISGISYPPRALRQELEGTVGVLLEIDNEGRVVDCRPTRSSNYYYLDSQTCIQLERHARYVFTDSGKSMNQPMFLDTAVGWRLN